MQLQARTPCPKAPSLAPALMSASRLMSEHAAGDAHAFAALYPMLRPKLAHICRSYVGPDEVEDLLQEVFFKLHRARGTYTPGRNAFAWAYAVARTTCLDRLRSRARRIEVPMEPATLEQRPAPTHTRELNSLLEGFSDCLRTTYLLVKVEGLECREAAEVLGTTTSAVKQRIHRATALLRTRLRDEAEV